MRDRLTPALALDLTTYLRFVLALLFVLGLAGLAGVLFRRFGAGAVTRSLGRARRLSVEAVLPLDARRRLVLVRCDRTEHLLLLGPGVDLVIESGIPVAAPPPGAQDAPTPDPAAEGLR